MKQSSASVPAWLKDAFAQRGESQPRPVPWRQGTRECWESTQLRAYIFDRDEREVADREAVSASRARAVVDVARHRGIVFSGTQLASIWDQVPSSGSADLSGGANWLRRLHDKSDSERLWMAKPWDAVSQDGWLDGEGVSEQVLRQAHALTPQIQQACEKIESIRADVLIHGDVGAMSLRRGISGVHAVNWEHAGQGPRAWDVANWVLKEVEAGDGGQASEAVLRAYGEHPDITRENLEACAVAATAIKIWQAARAGSHAEVRARVHAMARGAVYHRGS